MLDENLRVLSRRVHDLELESTERKDIIQRQEKEKKQLEFKLAIIYKDQEKIRLDVEEELRERIEEKDKEIRK